MDTPARIIQSYGHIATRRQLLAEGLSGTDLTRAVRLGEIRRVRQAHYATPGASQEALAAVRVGGALFGVSAAASFGLWPGLDRRVHVGVATNASRLRTNLPPGAGDELTPDIGEQPVVLHWIDDRRNRECWRVSVAAALRQTVAMSDIETGIACLDTALTKLRIGTDTLATIFECEPWGSRLVAARARRGSDSGPESIVRQRLMSRGIEVQQQVRIAGVGRVDMRIRHTRVLIEIDGRAYHSSPSAFENDRRRDAELVARGYVVVRLSYQQVMFDWPWCERMILAALSRPS